MKKQVGVIVWEPGMNIENFKQSFIDRFENVNPEKKSPLKITFDEHNVRAAVNADEEGVRWIEVWGEE